MSRFARRLQQSSLKLQVIIGDFPDGTTSGIPSGTSLTSFNGTYYVTVDNTVVDGFDIYGHIEVTADNVTIRNCKIHYDGTDTGIQNQGNGHVTIQDCEIYSLENAIGWANYTVQRCDMHSLSGDGLKWGSNTLIEDNYIHNFTPGPGAHNDGLQMSDESTNAVLRHNWVQIPWNGPGNGAVFIQLENGVNSAGPVLIEDNYLDGGGFTVYLNNKGAGNQNGVTVRNNTIGPNHEYGMTYISLSGVIWSGNVDIYGNPVTP